MKKLSKILIGLWISILILGIGQSSLAVNKKATLILPETGTKKVVEVNSNEANHYFDLGYHLMTNLLGGSFTPTTAYAERLSVSVAANAATIYVSSVLDRDGILLPLSVTNKGYFTLEPGTSREESIVCTSASSTLNALTGCTRGLAASGSDETGSSARAYSHNAGSKVIMTDIAQFFGNFVDITNSQTVGGIKHFTNNPTTSTTTPTSENQIITKKYVDDSVVAGGAIGSEILPGIWEGATVIEMTSGVATSTYNGSDYNLILQSKYANATSSATTTIPITKSNGKLSQSFIDLTEDFDFSGKVSGVISPSLVSNGSDGALNVVGTTTVNLAGAKYYIKDYSSISIIGTSSLVFTNPSITGTIVILKSQGDCIITSSANPAIDLRGVGATSSSYAIGINGRNSAGNIANASSATVSGGTSFGIIPQLANYNINLIPGSSGGAVGANVGAPGGGSLLLSCNSSLNISSIINASGNNGTKISGLPSTTRTGAGGGASMNNDGLSGSFNGSSQDSGTGGGGGGNIVLLYKTLISNTGTYTVLGGTGGTSDYGSIGGNGGLGFSYVGTY